jgi:hypothetical protein
VTRSSIAARFCMWGFSNFAGFVIPNEVRNLLLFFASGVSFHGDKSLMGTTQSMYSG